MEPQEADPALLVAAARDGDRPAFAALVVRERPALVMTARGIVGDGHEAEDCAQEALVAAWRHLEQLRDPRRFRAWLFRILVRHAQRRHAGLARRAAPAELGGIAAPHVPGEAARATVRAAVARLPTDLRVPLSLFYFAGLSYRETAEALHVREALVKSRLYEARRQLERRLTGART